MKILGGRSYARRLNDGTTLMVWFDGRNWTASFQRSKQPVSILNEGFPSAEDAKTAIMKRVAI